MIINIIRVNADQRRALGQAITFQQILSSQFNPTFCHHLLNRHPTACGKMQTGEIQLLELFIVQQRIEQGVNTSDSGKRIFR